ncbi:HtaA domain-containing protein [Streptomyces sp. NPDC051577]|uniref:HtaA domain-containing protein n=1 Tax=Streptomyces sp. NPDC051577 TaxID=3155166 RepID=UPI00343D7491
MVKGTLDWGAKETCRTYVTTVAKGEITVADGATKNADGTFRFGAPTGRYTPSGAHLVTTGAEIPAGALLGASGAAIAAGAGAVLLARRRRTTQS